jgi:hypothetical protein
MMRETGLKPKVYRANSPDPHVIYERSAQQAQTDPVHKHKPADVRPLIGMLHPLAHVSNTQVFYGWRVYAYRFAYQRYADTVQSRLRRGR